MLILLSPLLLSAKNDLANAEGGTLGILWVGKATIALVLRSGMHPS